MPTQTTDQLVSYYANLLIYQYFSKLRAYNNVFVDVEPVLMPQGFMLPLTDNEGNPIVDNEGDWVYSGSVAEPILPLALQDAFNLGSAMGAQLDTLAKYVGGVRTNPQLDGTYLTLDDIQFSAYLQVLAVRNNLGSDLGSIDGFLHTYFPGDFSVFDFENMRMSFVYHPLAFDPIAESFIMAGQLPVPMAVGFTFIFNPQSFSFFAFRTYNAVSSPGTSGYNFYSGPQLGAFLLYSNSLIVTSTGFPSPSLPLINAFGMGTYLIPAGSGVAAFNTYTTYLFNTPWPVYT